jgi:protein-S-isoprenylcysteine O-methyltransferase Ste14
LYRYLFSAMWTSWALYWWIASRSAKRTARKESLSSRLSYIAPLLVSIYLLSARNVPVAVLRERFVPGDSSTLAVAAALTAAGLLFAVWARRHIAGNWSASVTVKEGHELVTTGPYAILRHPIYSGLLLALVSSAIAVGEWRAVLAVALALLYFVPKLRLEERWMRQEFGEAYRVYCERTRALVPFVW